MGIRHATRFAHAAAAPVFSVSAPPGDERCVDEHSVAQKHEMQTQLDHVAKQRRELAAQRDELEQQRRKQEEQQQLLYDVEQHIKSSEQLMSKRLEASSVLSLTLKAVLILVTLSAFSYLVARNVPLLYVPGGQEERRFELMGMLLGGSFFTTLAACVWGWIKGHRNSNSIDVPQIVSDDDPIDTVDRPI